MICHFSPLINGERAVVILFIGCILFSLPLSLVLHGVVLSIIALFALCTEICSETCSNSLSQFKTRPGASSGIFLGAITLPAVMLSKLIQLSRAFSLHQIESGELNYLAMQYWATSAICMSVLIFLCSVMRYSMDNQEDHPQHRPSDAKFSLSCILLCATIFVLFTIGMQTTLELMWVLFHGFAAVKLVQHLLHTFPSCASIGEALLVTMGLVIYFADMVACTIVKLHGYWTSSESVPIVYGIKRSEISTLIQGLLLGLLLFPIVFKFFLHIWNCAFCRTSSGPGAFSERGRAFLFFSSLGLFMVLIIPSWMQFVQDFQVHPLLWVVSFVFSEPVKRLSLSVYWVCVIYASVLRFYNISKSSKIERILLRKYYHLMAVLMFLPAVIFQPKFLDLAFGAALAVFLTLEIIRVWRIWPLGQLIHQFMNAFTDHRDSDLLIVSHFSLLLGCALPIWMSSGYNDRPLAPFAGILSLGIGDTMASMVGHKYGVLRWSKSGKKTIEGTAAGITSVLVACSVLLPILASTGYILTQHWVSLLLAVIVSGMLEAYTAQLDNAFIPLVFYSLLCL
ncbi:dolichol kinase EVAN [Ricinus communis]|uniref:dolichol kinase EVAN n=1 Tax=Ricinus communis TaxID=3988 RepID=UPI00201A499A|nr:dolichol kinase EVAN [Ricinus communis]